MPRLSIADMPGEIVDGVVSELAQTKPASTREALEEPSPELLDSDYKPLKNFASTCKAFRRAAFYSIFQYLRIGFDIFTPNTSESADASSCLMNLAMLARFVTHYQLTDILGLTLFFPAQTKFGDHYLPDFINTLFSYILSDLNPAVLTLIATPTVLSHLMQIQINDEDVWAFGLRVHILQLKQGKLKNKRTIKSQSSLPSDFTNPASTLLKARPWKAAILNEASSLSVYSSYEYFGKRTPSILFDSQLHANPTTFSCLSTLRHLTYVIVFPIARHIRELAQALVGLRSLETLTTQLTPSLNARENVLENQEAVGRANLSDLWMETSQSYDILAQDIGINLMASRLRRWTAKDVRVCAIDAILGPWLIGWRMKRPGCWGRGPLNTRERAAGAVSEASSSDTDA